MNKQCTREIFLPFWELKREKEKIEIHCKIFFLKCSEREFPYTVKQLFLQFQLHILKLKKKDFCFVPSEDTIFLTVYIHAPA